MNGYSVCSTDDVYINILAKHILDGNKFDFRTAFGSGKSSTVFFMKLQLEIERLRKLI